MKEIRKMSSSRCVLDMPWNDRVCSLTKGCRVVTNGRQIQLRLMGPTKANGVPLLATKKSATDAIFLAWGKRRLAVSSMTSMRVVGRRSLAVYSNEAGKEVFAFESNDDLLAWCLTLRILAAPYIDERRPLAETQRRYYLQKRRDPPAKSSVVHSLDEVCPVLYPIADRIKSTCAFLGLSFSKDASPGQKLLVWTAVAVLEAKEPYEIALNTMRSLLHDFGCSDKNGKLLPRVDDSDLARCFGLEDFDESHRSTSRRKHGVKLFSCCCSRFRRRRESADYSNVARDDDDDDDRGIFLVKQCSGDRRALEVVVASQPPTLEKMLT